MYQKEDNRFKIAIREAILTELYAPVEERNKNILTKLVERNCLLLKQDDMARDKAVKPEHSHLSFAYNGKFYNVGFGEGPPVRNRAHPSLIPEIRAYAEEEHEVLVFEKALVEGYLTAVLSLSRRPGDYLLLLPQSLHDTVQRTISTQDWSSDLSQEKIDAFFAKHRPRYDLIRRRMATNLIL